MHAPTKPPSDELPQQQLEERQRMADEGVKLCMDATKQWGRVQRGNNFSGKKFIDDAVLVEMDAAMEKGVATARASRLHEVDPQNVRIRVD